MAEHLSSDKRSKIMASIRSKSNKDTELTLMQIFRQHKLVGWRRNRRIFGKPDFIFPKARLAVFVDGCFWHACPSHGRYPETNAQYWKVKLSRNKDRDKLVVRSLRNAGWRVLRVWEHSLARP